jgi:hypothetical protein
MNQLLGNHLQISHVGNECNCHLDKKNMATRFFCYDLLYSLTASWRLDYETRTEPLASLDEEDRDLGI